MFNDGKIFHVNKGKWLVRTPSEVNRCGIQVRINNPNQVELKPEEREDVAIHRFVPLSKKNVNSVGVPPPLFRHAYFFRLSTSISTRCVRLSFLFDCFREFLSFISFIPPTGIKILAHLIEVDVSYAFRHQVTVIDCLNDPDDTLKRKVSLMQAIVTSQHVVPFI